MINEMDDLMELMKRRETFDKIRERFTKGTPAQRRVMADEEAAWFEYTVLLEGLVSKLWEEKVNSGAEAMEIHQGPAKASQLLQQQ